MSCPSPSSGAGCTDLRLNVLLLGGPQSGKSATGNTLLGSRDFPSRLSPGAVTTECRLRRQVMPAFLRRQGRQAALHLSVLDTPAYPNLLLSPEEVKHTVAHAVEQGFKGGPHVLLLVLRADTPPCDAAGQLTHFAEDLFGPEWRGHTLLALSHGDRVDQAHLGSTEYLMQASGAFQALLETVERRHHFVDNSATWLRTEGRPLLEKLVLLTRKNKYRGLQLKSV
uniref:GIMAP family P-loop NTPase domain containing 1 n=1 Tax=Paramormyrops kingsleyae TaxID=1676925 RepID=A0A3B3SRL9_9TELE|nr:GTPase IMAP family member GIMD1 [Paramormyrops kingsleyae]XP_023683428.1 GTPase IMAP family member GIMD1 [Paramormyrops kingsleyae]XP_023683429.1 GTPase IMAP family member GIMD1 [Paramormyrops kingsleyae]